MEEIKVKIKEVQDYFKQRIFNGEFTIESWDKYTALILVDGQYNFAFWIGNNRDNCKQYFGLKTNFITINTTIHENRKIWAQLNKQLKPLRKQADRKEKMQKYLELQKELGL